MQLSSVVRPVLVIYPFCEKCGDSGVPLIPLIAAAVKPRQPRSKFRSGVKELYPANITASVILDAGPSISVRL